MNGWLTRLLRRRTDRRASTADGVPPAQAGSPGEAPPGAGWQQLDGGPLRFGRYIVQDLLAQGAVNRIFVGLDPATGARVAIKTMVFDGGDSPAASEARRRFLREATTAARLQHPAIVLVQDSGVQGRAAYIVMELLPGGDLRRHCCREARLPAHRVLEMAARVADALAYAHRQGVVHRDIKPANLLVDLRTDSIKVTDFGIARTADGSLTRTGLMLGSPSYMAPEQLLGEPVDGRADLYSLAVVLFEMLTSRLPHQEESISSLMRAIATDAAPPLARYRPDLPSTVGDLLGRALQKDRSLRFPDGEQLAKALREAANRCRPADAHAGKAPPEAAAGRR